MISNYTLSFNCRVYQSKFMRCLKQTMKYDSQISILILDYSDIFYIFIIQIIILAAFLELRYE